MAKEVVREADEEWDREVVREWEEAVAAGEETAAADLGQAEIVFVPIAEQEFLIDEEPNVRICGALNVESLWYGKNC